MKGRPFLHALLVAAAAGFLLQPGCSRDSDSQDPRQDAWVLYEHPHGSDYNSIRSFQVDSSLGGFWVGHNLGISFFDHRGTLLDTSDDLWVRFDSNDGLCQARTVYLDPNVGVWIRGAGICHLDPSGTPFDKSDDVWTTFDITDGLNSLITTDMAFDGPGSMWIGQAEGADFFNYNGTPSNKTDDAWVHFYSLEGMSDVTPWVVRVEPGVGVWFGHFYGADLLDYGPDPFNKADDAWVNFLPPGGLATEVVDSMAIHPGGLKWFGTVNDIAVLDDGGTPFITADDSWLIFPVKNHPNRSNAVRSTFVGNGDTMLFGTASTGVYVLHTNGTPLDQSDDYGVYSRPRNGLPGSGSARAVVSDASGGIWAGTLEGMTYLPSVP